MSKIRPPTTSRDPSLGRNTPRPGTNDVDQTIWEIGGQLAKFSPRQLQDQWTKGHASLRRVDRYATAHFIPPFNGRHDCSAQRHGLVNACEDDASIGDTMYAQLPTVSFPVE